MSEPPYSEPPEPSTAVLILKGVLLIIGAFFSGALILFLHLPAGH